MASRSRSPEGRSRRGFAAMDPEAQREISRRGGAASHESGRGHEFSPEEAREAGRRGGEARWGNRGSRPAPLQEEGREERPRRESESRFRHEEEEEEDRGEGIPRGYATLDPEGRDGGGAEEDDIDPGGPRRRELGRGHQFAREDPRGISRSRVGTQRRSEEQELQREGRSRRGFASMDPKEQRDIARRGGEASGRARGSHDRCD